MHANTYKYPDFVAPQLVPSTAWGSNLRAVLTPNERKKVRLLIFKKHGEKCWFCKSKPKVLDCHEVWSYTYGTPNIQSLENIIPLCKSCHAVCHIGFWSLKGPEYFDKYSKHLAKVRKITLDLAHKEISNAFKIHEQMSQVEWELDISCLEQITKG